MAKLPLNLRVNYLSSIKENQGGCRVGYDMCCLLPKTMLSSIHGHITNFWPETCLNIDRILDELVQ